MFYHRQFETFDPKSGDVPVSPFAYLPEIAERARGMLIYRTAQQITITAKRINEEIERYFGDLKYIAISELKIKLQEHGNVETFETFFEWNGGDWDDSGSNKDWLFKDDMEDELEILTEKNTSEVDALKTIIDARDSCFFLPEGAPEPAREEWVEGTRYELFAVLALWLLADALEWINRKQPGLSIAGEFAIKAMDAVCYAEHLHQEDWLFSYIKKTNNKELAEALHKQKTESREAICKEKSEKSRKAANALHDLPGGSREKQEKIRTIWASGKYTSRSICAEQECAGLGMSYDSARKALRNTPAPI